jgi:hypothetical protein
MKIGFEQTEVVGRGTFHSAVLLWLFTFLFFLRVAGQAFVAFFGASFLPPMEAWYSGLIPYPILLPIQIGILVLQVKVSLDLSRQHGWFSVPSPRFGRFLRGFSAFYAAVMVVRYVATMALLPERRWFGGTIPIFFHFVLAAFLFTWGSFHVRR